MTFVDVVEMEDVGRRRAGGPTGPVRLPLVMVSYRSFCKAEVGAIVLGFWIGRRLVLKIWWNGAERWSFCVAMSRMVGKAGPMRPVSRARAKFLE
jgi:hypothetical protein